MVKDPRNLQQHGWWSGFSFVGKGDGLSRYTIIAHEYLLVKDVPTLIVGVGGAALHHHAPCMWHAGTPMCTTVIGLQGIFV